MAERKCVFAGSFDPPTLGHKALIEDCLRLFDEVAVAVMVNPEKRPYFSEKEREDMLRLMFPKEKRLKIVFFFRNRGGIAGKGKYENLRAGNPQHRGFRIRKRQLFRFREAG